MDTDWYSDSLLDEEAIDSSTWSIPLSGPETSAHKPLLRLALECFGRAWAAYVNGSPNILKSAGTLDQRHEKFPSTAVLLALDGIRIALQELHSQDGLSEACDVFDMEVRPVRMGESTPNFYVELVRRFSRARGIGEGRDMAETVQQAVEDARRKVVVSDPDAFAARVAENIAAQLPSIPVATRARIEDELKARLGVAWLRPPDSVREQIVEAEWLSGLLEIHEGRDYTPVVVYYGKALESLLQHLSRSNDILSQFRRQLLDGRDKIRWLSNNAPEQLRSRLVEAIDLRNPAAHGERGPYRPVPRTRMARMRGLVLGQDSEDGLIGLLHQHAKWP
jgi:hypothetical protein